ncbi:hypothetical protein [Cryptosporangium minutisporangium]|uniref:hypothetical protein n=1 Tax=Cryptosporangium minutisporangium TaxID=113569 RepID=UPI0031E744D0
MSGLAVLLVLVALAGLLAGVASGWYLRSINAWCPRCGGAVNCTACGERPSWPHHRWTHSEANRHA